MKHDPITTGKRKAVNITMDTGIVATARSLGLNLSQISEDAIRNATKEVEERRWKAENRTAIEGWNRWYEKNGNPLDKYRAW